MGPQIVKVCLCGRAFTQAAWEALRRLPDWHLAGEIHELRTCLCGTTLAIDRTSRPRMASSK